MGSIAASCIACASALAAPEALGTLRWVHLEVSHQLLAPLSLEGPFTLGALYRSVFGLALSRRSEAAFELFFGGNNETPRPWWWWPAEVGMSTRLPAGTMLVSRLTLQDSAWAHLDACLAGLGDFFTHGLGRERAPALLTQVRVITPLGVVPLEGGQPACWSADALWQATLDEVQKVQKVQDEDVQALHVRTCSPLYLKEFGGVLRQAPTLQTLVQRCMGRAHMLLPVGIAPLLPRQDKLAWLQGCSAIAADNAQTVCVRVPRYSARQGRAMHIEGLSGSWSYSGAAVTALPWLRLAEHLQLGGKTTLGFGALKIDSSALANWHD